jgi:rhodanese-related sulfurtransferase
MFNPHGLPSRMTVGYLLELIAGKVGCLSGQIMDGTSFTGTGKDEIENMLHKLGFRFDGKESMYSGVTGKRMHSKMTVLRQISKATMVSFLIDNWMLVLVAVLSGLALLLPTLQVMGKAGLSPTQAVLMINRERAHIVDVRSPEEFSSGHLIGAKNIAIDVLESSLGKAINDKKRPLILVCASGVRSQRAQKIATKLGFEQAHSLSGGLKIWQEANLPLEKT